MWVGILSDTHNNQDNTRKALAVFQERGIRRLFHCGDLIEARMAPLFTGFQVTFVRGNVDRDIFTLEQAVQAVPGLTWAGREASVELAGRWLAMCHGDDPRQLNDLIHCGVYAWVLHGHTHRQRDVRFGPTRVINPGALGGKVDGPRSVCILDPENDQMEVVIIENR